MASIIWRHHGGDGRPVRFRSSGMATPLKNGSTSSPRTEKGFRTVSLMPLANPFVLSLSKDGPCWKNEVTSRMGLFVNIFQGFTRPVVVTMMLVGVGLAVQMHH